MTEPLLGTSLITIPQRVSLVAQTADVLQKEIERGVWKGCLPGEHALCARLRVSRPTLRGALKALQRAGWIEVSQGKRRRLASPPKAVARGKKSQVSLLQNDL